MVGDVSHTGDPERASTPDGHLPSGRPAYLGPNLARFRISTRRLVLVHGLIGALALPSFYAMAVHEELWPYSPYPMYSRIRSESPESQYYLAGLTNEEPVAEIPLPASWFVGRLGRLRFAHVLRAIDSGERREESLQLALDYFLSTYEAERLRSRAPRPALRGVRLYRAETPAGVGQGLSLPVGPAVLVAERIRSDEG
jgi:hypothetical protein